MIDCVQGSKVRNVQHDGGFFCPLLLCIMPSVMVIGGRLWQVSVDTILFHSKRNARLSSIA